MSAQPSGSTIATQPEHLVQFYEDDAFLYESAGGFLAAGVDAEQAIVIIATAAHRDGLIDGIAARGVDVDVRRQTGEITLLDAHEVLATFMADGMPDERRFRERVGGVIDDALRRSGRTAVRAYGEMVDVLWREGQAAAAIRLEELWHDLVHARPVSLLCAYAMGNFYSEPAGAGLAEVAGRHTRVLPGEIEQRRQLEAGLREALAARRRAEAAVREREEELRDFIENAAEGLHWVGADGAILWANQAELDLLGYTREEYVGRHIADFHADRPAIDDILARLARNETLQNYEARLRAKDGTIRHVLISSNVLWRDGAFHHTRCFTRDITSRRLAEEARDRLAAIVDSSDDPIIGKTLDGTIGSWNRAAERTFGYTAAEAVGQHITLIVPGERRAEEADVLARLARGETIDHVETERRTRDGRRLTVSLTVSPVRDASGRILGAATIVRDISEQKRARDELQRSERAARFLADAGAALSQVSDLRSTLAKIAELAVPDFADWCAVDVATPEGGFERLAVTHVDPEKRRLAYEISRRWPQPADAPRGPRYVLRTGHSDMLEEIPDARLVQAARDEDHLRTMRALGFKSFISVPIRSEQTIYGVLTFVTAESDRRYDARDLQTAEDLARRAAVAIENVDLYEKLQQAVRFRDEFLSMAGHELRNPLNALQLQLVGLLRVAEHNRDRVLPAWVSERLTQAVDDLDRLVRLVHNLLDMTRITAGRLDLEFEEVDLSAVVRAAADRLRPQLGERQLSLALQPAVGYWDRLRLDQIVTNLLTNAIKYGDGKPIAVSVAADDAGVRLSVADHGIGIEEARQQTIFERFERGVSRRQYGGFGLGLWITRSLVEAMGGRIGVESRVGDGSTFSVALPRRSPHS